METLINLESNSIPLSKAVRAGDFVYLSGQQRMMVKELITVAI